MEDASRRDNSYMVADQSFASERPDVLTFTSEVLEETLKLQGPVRVKLDLSLTSDDADIVVKFIDVHPDGYQMLVRGDVFPLRYRQGYDKPLIAIPGEMIHLDFTMNDIAHWILSGHRMMIQIQSSCFPLVNLNPQTFMDNIYDAEIGDYVKSDIRIYHQQDAPSHIILPIAG
jgi:putative CocE/NonD family hydrolase